MLLKYSYRFSVMDCRPKFSEDKNFPLCSALCSRAHDLKFTFLSFQLKLHPTKVPRVGHGRTQVSDLSLEPGADSTKPHFGRKVFGQFFTGQI
jgi:hypothetical protein